MKTYDLVNVNTKEHGAVPALRNDRGDFLALEFEDGKGMEALKEQLGKPGRFAVTPADHLVEGATVDFVEQVEVDFSGDLFGVSHGFISLPYSDF